ncbi:DDE Tnp4 domain-containing protein [Trichonephila clavipes]|nr:DDE Tnp4 domain-containing protein [Trichonephila clavipes]
MAIPSPDEWSKIAQDYKDKSNMPNCIGCADGKHCRIQRPPNAGSLFYNYKDFHSIVLLADADAYACFTMIEVGAYGKDNDSSIFTQSEMGKAYNAKQLNIPQRGFSLPGSAHRTEMYIVGDEAFPLQKNLRRPFPRRNLDFSKRNFNFTQSRARKSSSVPLGFWQKNLKFCSRA